MSNKVYDILKDLAQLWIPAASTLYVALAGVWGLPLAKEVAGTLAAVDGFLGCVLKISTAHYKVTKDADGQ